MKIAAYGLLFSIGALLTRAQTSPLQGTRATPFKHVVVIFQENRTPDNLFQGLCVPPYGTAASCSATPASGQYDIQTRNWADKNAPNGVIQPALVALANHYDLSHAHSAFTAMCDADPVSGECKMDGAGGVKCSGICLSNHSSDMWTIPAAY
jgi:phospholipase C